MNRMKGLKASRFLAVAFLLSNIASFAQSPISPPLTFQPPQVGVHAGSAKDGSRVVETFSLLNRSQGGAANTCPTDTVEFEPILQGGWLHLSMSATPKDMLAVRRWLSERNLNLRDSNRVVLARAAAQLEVFLDAVFTKRPRPAVISFLLRNVPRDCDYQEAFSTTAQAAARELHFPVGLSLVPTDESSMLSSMNEQFLEELSVSWLIGAIAHEATHVFQMFPFDAGLARRPRNLPHRLALTQAHAPDLADHGHGDHSDSPSPKKTAG